DASLRLSREAGDLLDPEDDELGGPDDGDTDLADEPSVQDVVGGHRGLVAADEERVLGLASEQRAAAPLRMEERGHAVDDAAPRLGRVRLEDDELRAAIE